ncbi:hypothetical protein A2415_02990 [candidate division WWE3 bacterium RIFOXYC1_FULL_39_7]|uniref:N-acetyltransferase domain-containing protein n=2 Tax=Katanobacteria TaxID=422282 RepID=A0A1F4X8G4_UNCKA|nr:MAG: hypothetical protein A2415_02990 [candidate division WWE3 bacterium RIFOXYC1_FULL_39_7]OGC78000.1 MAG: hypothetical protein A2619_02840 [candidate division WWE3 bacterium RIFOXYD1_FULL_39_9]
MENINVQKIEKSDAERFFELYKAISLSDFDKWSEESKEKWFSDDYSLDYWKNLLEEDKLPIFVAVENNKFVGYVMLEGINFGVGYLGWIGVLKDLQGKGVGSILIKKIEDWSSRNGIHKLELETQEPTLQIFYEKHGFTLEGIRKNSWQHLDNYMFGKELTGSSNS